MEFLNEERRQRDLELQQQQQQQLKVPAEGVHRQPRRDGISITYDDMFRLQHHHLIECLHKTTVK